MLNKQDMVRRVLTDFYEKERLVNSYFKDKEVQFAIDFLQANEQPEMIVRGSTAGEYEEPVSGYLWCTNVRLFFAGAKGSILKKPVYEEFHYGSIATVVYKPNRLGGLVGGELILHMSTTSAHGRVAQRKYSLSSTYGEHKNQAFVDYLRRRIDSLHPTSVTGSVPQAIKTDLVEQLERLGELKTQGLITEEEFQAAKKRLLQ